MGWGEGADIPIGSFWENSSWDLFGPWASGRTGALWGQEALVQGGCGAGLLQSSGGVRGEIRVPWVRAGSPHPQALSCPLQG